MRLGHNQTAKYTFRLYESHTMPHTYSTAVRYFPYIEPYQQDAGNGLVIPVNDLEALKNAIGDLKKRKKEDGSGMEMAGGGSGNAILQLVRRDIEIARLLCPIGSDFNVAFEVVRRAFRELTFLTWEERLLHSARRNELQKARAAFPHCEPF